MGYLSRMMIQAISLQKKYVQGRPNLRRPRSLKVTFGSGGRPTACDPNTYKQTYSWRLRVSVRLRRTLVWHAHSGPLLTYSLLYLFRRRDLCLYVIRDYDSSLPQDHENTGKVVRRQQHATDPSCTYVWTQLPSGSVVVFSESWNCKRVTVIHLTRRILDVPLPTWLSRVRPGDVFCGQYWCAAREYRDPDS